MNKLLYSPGALNDLDEIWAYINNELQNPAAAIQNAGAFSFPERRIYAD